jgi:hypothetical protein
MAPWDSDSFQWPHGLRWLTIHKGGSVGSDKKSLDGSIISFRLPVRNTTIPHRFKARWVPLSLVRQLRNGMNTPGIYRVYGMKCIFPPDANFDAKPVADDPDFQEHWVENEPLDLWDVEFDVILIED